jgi:hypothetical protein
MSAARPLPFDLGAVRPTALARHRLLVWVFCCLAIAVLLAFGSLLIGTSSVRTSLDWLLQPDAESSVVLWQIRLPRTIGAWLAGALLGLAGGIAQGVFRNPLAEPYLLGTASGAALGVTITLIAADASFEGLAWAAKVGITGAACIGAAGATLLTVSLSRGVLQTRSLLLSGVVVAFLLGSITQLLVLSRPEIWRTMQSFIFGSTGFLRCTHPRGGYGAIPGSVVAAAASDAARHSFSGERGCRRSGGRRRVRRSHRPAHRARDAVGEPSAIADRGTALRRRASAERGPHQPMGDSAVGTARGCSHRLSGRVVPDLPFVAAQRTWLRRLCPAGICPSATAPMS